MEWAATLLPSMSHSAAVGLWPATLLVVLQAVEWTASLLRSQQTMQDLTEDRDPTSPLDMAEWDEGSSMTSGTLASCGAPGCRLLMLPSMTSGKVASCAALVCCFSVLREQACCSASHNLSCGELSSVGRSQPTGQRDCLPLPHVLLQVLNQGKTPRQQLHILQVRHWQHQVEESLVGISSRTGPCVLWQLVAAV